MALFGNPRQKKLAGIQVSEASLQSAYAQIKENWWLQKKLYGILTASIKKGASNPSIYNAPLGKLSALITNREMYISQYIRQDIEQEIQIAENIRALTNKIDTKLIDRFIDDTKKRNIQNKAVDTKLFYSVKLELLKPALEKSEAVSNLVRSAGDIEENSVKHVGMMRYSYFEEKRILEELDVTIGADLKGTINPAQKKALGNALETLNKISAASKKQLDYLKDTEKRISDLFRFEQAFSQDISKIIQKAQGSSRSLGA